MATRPVAPEEMERTLKAVSECGGNLTEAARWLGIPRGTVQSRVLSSKIGGMPKMAYPNPETPIKVSHAPKRHLIIPDVQAKPGVPLDHLTWAGNYIAEKKPEVIVMLGDFADMPSLSSYDRGTASAENRRYKADVEACHQAMEMLMEPIVKAKDYKPRLVLTLGNHEDRITRYGDSNPALHEFVSIKDLGYEAWGWEVHAYREVVKIDGIAYSHYFYNQNTGKPLAGQNLDTRLKTIGMSFTMGHQQGLKTAIRELADGTRQRGLVAGSFYQHNEEYRGPQASFEWRGLIMKHEVNDGDYDLMEVSMNFLKRRYS